jgi:ATP-binding cassette subfamily C protein
LVVNCVKYENEVALNNSKIFGMLGEIFLGISKIRLCGAEYRFFLNWARQFSAIQNSVRKAQRTMVFFHSITDAMPLLVICVMYIGLGVIYKNSQQFSTGDFMAFNIALGQITMMLYSMRGEIDKLVKVIAQFTKTKIFIETAPEVSEVAKDPGELLGRIDIVNVSFKYPDSDTLILNDLSLSIEQGEYVAFVGKSGSGKSTLLRLLLGFDQATKGRIYFDYKDLSDIDVTLLRRKMGVVLHHDDLLPGNIFQNISGITDLTIDEAWDVAEKCGIADDILAMPMQMNTMISMEGGGLSGGQRQRILIARAIARNPNILILDEATRALDNISQSVVIESLSRLKITRIVVAHRLSTLQKVDKIFVLNEGQVVEVGSYKDLIDSQGIFYSMIIKQRIVPVAKRNI